MSLNRVMVTGNLTRDPELRQTATGMSVLSFGIAVNDRRKNSQTGEWEDYPNYLDCTLFGARADGLSKILTKGSKVAIDGKLRWSKWEKDGQKRSKVEIIVDSLDFMSQRNNNSMNGQNVQQFNDNSSINSNTNNMYNPNINNMDSSMGADDSSATYDDDIPF